MRARMSIDKPDDVEVSMTITMSAKQWCALRDNLTVVTIDLPHYSAAYKLQCAITDLLAKVRKIVWAEDEAA